MTDSQAKMSALIQVVKADALLDEKEVEQLLTIASRAGFSKDELTELANQQPKGLAKLNASDKIRLFYQALLLANVDDVVSDEETMVLHDLGLALQLPAFKVQILIQNVKAEGSTALSDDDLENLLQL